MTMIVPEMGKTKAKRNAGRDVMGPLQSQPGAVNFKCRRAKKPGGLTQNLTIMHFGSMHDRLNPDKY